MKRKFTLLGLLSALLAVPAVEAESAETQDRLGVRIESRPVSDSYRTQLEGPPSLSFGLRRGIDFGQRRDTFLAFNKKVAFPSEEVAINRIIELPDDGEYGSNSGHFNGVEFSFTATAGAVIVYYEANTRNVIEILVNKTLVGKNIIRSKNWSPTQILIVKGQIIKGNSRNILRFNYRGNPQKSSWGIRNVAVGPAWNPPQALSEFAIGSSEKRSSGEIGGWVDMPKITVDGTTLTFVRDDCFGHPDAGKPLKGQLGNNQFDIFISRLINGRFSTPRALPEPINLGKDPFLGQCAEEADANFNPSQNRLYFSRVWWETESELRFDIYSSQRIKGKPINLGPKINHPDAQDDTFSLSPDEKMIVWTRSYPEGDPRNLDDGGLHLSTRARIDDNSSYSSWGPAIRLPLWLGHPVHHAHLSYAHGGKRLYFVSPVLQTAFFIDLTKNGKWTKPQHFMPYLPSGVVVGSPSLTGDEQAIYFLRLHPDHNPYGKKVIACGDQDKTFNYNIFCGNTEIWRATRMR